MKTVQLMAVRDRQLDAFTLPFIAPTIGAAIRAFTDTMNDKGSEPHKHPEDFDLYHLGTISIDTGTLEQTKSGKADLVMLGSNVIAERKTYEFNRS